MDHTFCPGSKILRQPAPEFFDCPTCGYEVEIWTDELKAACPKCATPVYRDTAMSCLDWCKRGKECVGDSVFSNYMQNKAVGMKSNLLRKIREQFPDDTSRIDHVERVVEHAEALLKAEQGDWHIVVPASILRELDQQGDSPKVVRDTLFRLGLRLEDIDEICDIVARDSSEEGADSNNYRIWHDAEALANLPVSEGAAEVPFNGSVNDTFLTETAAGLARQMLTGSPAANPAVGAAPA